MQACSTLVCLCRLWLESAEGGDAACSFPPYAFKDGRLHYYVCDKVEGPLCNIMRPASLTLGNGWTDYYAPANAMLLRSACTVSRLAMRLTPQSICLRLAARRISALLPQQPMHCCLPQDAAGKLRTACQHERQLQHSRQGAAAGRRYILLPHMGHAQGEPQTSMPTQTSHGLGVSE